jgi:hypothetical protein
MIRYARAPSAQLRALLAPGGWLSGLIDRGAATGLPLPPDVHLRERDRVHVYCGLTRLIDVALRADGVLVRAHRTYSSQACAGGLLRRWSSAESGLAEEVRRYFAEVRIGSTHVRAEGAVQAAWSAMTEPWLPIDREAVLGYENKAARTLARAAEPVRLARAAVADSVASDTHAWATPSISKVSAELDQIAVDPRGRLVLLELKYGRASAASVYYSPLQLLQYVHEWAQAFDAVRADLRALIEARQAIGLSPPAMPELNGELRPAIAFGRDLPSDEVLRRFELVRAIANRHLPDGVPAIEVWNVTDRGTPNRIA